MRVLPVPVVVYPIGQDKQAASLLAVAPDFAYFPAAQAVIVPVQALEVNPGVEPYVPAGQGVHAAVVASPIE